MFMPDKVSKSNSQNQSNPSKLEPDSIRFNQEQTWKGQKLKGNKQPSQATHGLVKKKKNTSISVTYFIETDLPWDSMRSSG